MITYDSRNWLSALALHRSDTFRKLLPMLVLVGLLTWAIGYVEIEYLRLSEGDYVSNLPVMHSLLGFAISMLLVFRTNTAYDRWWEARRLWGQLWVWRLAQGRGSPGDAFSRRQQPLRAPGVPTPANS